MEYSILISLLINFISSQNNKITRDPLTRLLNKDFFNTIVYEWMDKKKPQGELFLLMCDIDNFKSINDCFGHIEGDNALVTFSKVLTEVCSKYNAISARVGGDEFAIIIETDSRKTVDMLINEINDMFSSISETKEYVLRTSIGCAKYRETDDVIDLFKAADRMLYKVKNEQKSLLKR